MQRERLCKLLRNHAEQLCAGMVAKDLAERLIDFELHVQQHSEVVGFLGLSHGWTMAQGVSILGG